MNLIELNRALRHLRLGGIAAVLETRLHQAQAEPMAPIDFLSCLVSDELTRRSDRLPHLRQARRDVGLRRSRAHCHPIPTRAPPERAAFRATLRMRA